VLGNLHTLAQEFLFYLEVERGFSKRTAEAYDGDLAQFMKHLQAIGLELTPADVTVDAVRSWMIAMHERGLSNSSIARHLAGLRSFWKFLRFKGIVVSDVPFQVTAPKRHRSLPVYLGAEDLQRLLDAALQQRVAFCAFRDFAVLATFIYAGLRRGELLSLKVSDVDLTEGTLRVVAGKGNKTRVVPMVPELQDMVLPTGVRRKLRCLSAQLWTCTLRGSAT
jgi:site-specific recombinase XerD